MRSHPFLSFLRRRWTTTGLASDGPVDPAPVGAVDRPVRCPADRPVLPPTQERQLADETEAFLAGTLAELVASQVQSLPPWLLLNRLAHADVDEIHRLARGEATPILALGAAPSDNRTWAMAEQSLAMHLLGAERDPEAIRRVQREELVPLELALITSTSVEPLTLSAIVAETFDIIDEHH